GLSRYRQVSWARRDDRRVDSLSHQDATRPRRHGALRNRRPDLRFDGRALPEAPLSIAGLARHRRQGADRGSRSLYRELFVGRLQRLSAFAAICDLTLALSVQWQRAALAPPVFRSWPQNRGVGPSFSSFFSSGFGAGAGRVAGG